jgi:V/A-type H+/Na+-transporting ATPase subunit E
MAEELQSLLEKINEEGVKKAELEKEKIIADAKKKAEGIIADAKKKAEEVAQKSELDAKRNEERAADTIRQASRDIILALRDELQNRLKAVVKECVGDSMTPEMMGAMVMEMEKSFLAGKSGEDAGIEVLLSKKDLDSMNELFKGSFGKNLKSDPDISLGHDFSAGLKIGFKGNDLFFDFSDDALAEMICAYIGPRLTAIINEKNK